MSNSISSSATQSVAPLQRDSAARKAGMFLVLAAFATVFAVLGRVSAQADQPTLLASLHAIADHRLLYGVGGGSRMVSGIALSAAAWFLMKTWIIQERLGSPWVPALFAVSGLCTALSGAGALILALAVPTDLDVPGALWATAAAIHEMAGKTGFAAAGLSLLIAARYQWRVGRMLRRIAPISALLGAGMQLIWLDTATQIHQYTGPLFLLWLLIIGGMLLTGRVEQHYVALRTARATAPQP